MDVIYDDPFWPFKQPDTGDDVYYKRDTVAAGTQWDTVATPSTSNATFLQQQATIPTIFQGCPNYRPSGSDDKYGYCNVTDPVEACRLLGKLHEVKEYRTYFLAIVPVVLSVFAFVFNALFLFLQWMVWRRAGSGHRKRYALILFRSSTSLLTLLCFYILLIVWQGGGLNYASVAVFIFIGSHDFFCIASTYLVLTGILYTAVVHPIFYKLKFRLVHCYAIVGCIYLVTMILSVCIGLFEATLFYPDTTPITCPVDKCGFPVAIVIVVLLALGTATVVLLYIILLFRMRARNRAELHTASVKSNESRSSQKRSSVVAMNRLAINMSTFTIATLPLLAISIYTLANFSNLSTLGQGEKSPCKTYLNSDLFVELELLASAAALIWVLSMAIDPVVNTFSDPKLVEEAKRILGIIKQKLTCRMCSKKEESP